MARKTFPKPDPAKLLEIIGLMTPEDGMKRTACRCNKCGELFGRRFIPYGSGRGITVNPCMCMVTNNQHGDFSTLMECTP